LPRLRGDRKLGRSLRHLLTKQVHPKIVVMTSSATVAGKTMTILTGITGQGVGESGLSPRRTSRQDPEMVDGRGNPLPYSHPT
jgi:hypothetical protein